MLNIIKKWATPFLLGLSLTLAYAPFHLWFILPLSLSLFLFHLQNSGTPFKSGFAFGLGWFGAGVSWVHVSIADFGGIPLIASVLMMTALASYLALYPALFAYFSKKYIHAQFWPLAIPIVWLTTEWLRGALFTGFPWLSIGYSQIDGPLSGWMPVIGETGVTAILLVICASCSVHLPKRQWFTPLLIVSVLLTTGTVLNQYNWTTPSKESVNVSLVQGNIAQEMRWVPAQELPTMQKYWEMTKDHWSSDIVIWPEAAIPKLEPFAQSYIQRLDEKASSTQTGLITGIVNYNLDTKEAFNSMLALGASARGDAGSHYRYQHNNRYIKNHLVPFGEFVPFEQVIRDIAPIFDLPMSSFTRGDYQQANLLSNGMNIASALCYEILFPQQLRANLTNDTQFIVTLSNDAWFGRSHGPAQHLQIAQVRAKEFGLPVLRATNNGYTAIVNSNGRIQSQIPQFEAAVLSDNVTLVKGTTPYRYFGDFWVWVFAVVGMVLSIIFQRKQR